MVRLALISELVMAASEEPSTIAASPRFVRTVLPPKLPITELSRRNKPPSSLPDTELLDNSSTREAPATSTPTAFRLGQNRQARFGIGTNGTGPVARRVVSQDAGHGPVVFNEQAAQPAVGDGIVRDFRNPGAPLYKYGVRLGVVDSIPCDDFGKSIEKDTDAEGSIVHQLVIGDLLGKGAFRNQYSGSGESELDTSVVTDTVALDVPDQGWVLGLFGVGTVVQLDS